MRRGHLDDGRLTGFSEIKISTPRLDHRELAADQQVIQALNRLTFGPRPGDAQKVRSMGLDKWIDLQLNPSRIDDTPFEQFASRYDMLNQDQNQLLQQYADAQRQRRLVRRDKADSAQISRDDSMAIRQIGLARRQFMGQLQSERVARAVASNRQLEEVMTDFWLNHFNVYAAKGPPGAYYLSPVRARRDSSARAREVPRPPRVPRRRVRRCCSFLDNARAWPTARVLGSAKLSFRSALMGGTGQRGDGIADGLRRAGFSAGAADQQRLQQLRNGGLNENYGRELLELHTIGVDGGYTQQDVINVARAFTGWTINPPARAAGLSSAPDARRRREGRARSQAPAGRGSKTVKTRWISSREAPQPQVHRHQVGTPVRRRRSATVTH